MACPIKNDERGSSIQHGLPEAFAKTASLKFELKAALVAKNILEERRRRTTELDASLFGEPAWEMLLELFVAEASGVAATSEGLKTKVGVAITSASRWLDVLADQGLVERRKFELDLSTELVELTDKARGTLKRYLLPLC